MFARRLRSLHLLHAVAPLLSVALVLAVHPLATQPWDPAAQEEREWRDLPALPDRADGSVADLELTAVALAAQLFAVPVDAAGTSCSPSRLRVSWSTPGAGYEVGAHLEPVGPAPTADTSEVNGVVLCQASTYAYMGFEAWRDGGLWRLAAVPFVAEEHEDHEEHGHGEIAASTPGAHAVAPAEHVPGPVAAASPPVTSSPASPPVAAPPAAGRGPVPAPTASAAPRNVLDLSSFGQAIDGYAAYEPQRTCSPAAKTGTAALRDQLLAQYAGSRNLGISRGCTVGGQSEHKEGRALDWGVLVSRPTEKAAGDGFVAALLASDSFGNRHALARRMGVMYVIWNRQIWSAYRPEVGWRPYGGVSPHTDHVHISLSWDGAMARTSFWAGHVTLSQLNLGQVEHAATAPGSPPAGAAPATTPVTAPSAPSITLEDPTRHDDGAHRDESEADMEGKDAGHHKGYGYDKGKGKGKGKGRKGRADEEGGVATTTGFIDLREGDSRALERAAQRRIEQERRAAQQLEDRMRREAASRADARREAERQAAEAARDAGRVAKEIAHAEEHARRDTHRHTSRPTTSSRTTAPAPPAPAAPSGPAPPKAPQLAKVEVPKPAAVTGPKAEAPNPPGGGNGKGRGKGTGHGKGKGGG